MALLIHHASEPNRGIALKALGYPQEILPVMQLTWPTLHVPPTAGWFKVATTFHHDVAIATTFINIISQLPNAAREV